MAKTITVNRRMITIHTQELEQYHKLPRGRYQRRHPLTPYCYRCKKPFAIGEKAYRTGTRVYCLDCEKQMFLDVPDEPNEDQEVQHFFEEES